MALVFAGCGHPPRQAAASTARDHIRHVVIIVQENRSFDNLFHGFPGADTANFGLTHDHRQVPLHSVSLKAPYDISNGVGDFVRSYDRGKMDGWDRRPTTLRLRHGRARFLYPQYGFVPYSEAEPYFELARRYVLADRMFQSNIDQSFVAHLYLIAGQAGRTADVPSGRPWGCDAAPGTLVRTLRDDRSMGRQVFPCFDFRTLGDELDAQELTWRYYAPKIDSWQLWRRVAELRRQRKPLSKKMHVPDFGQLWTSYDAIAHDRYGPDWSTNIVSPERQVIIDVKNGDLAAVTWVIPDWKNSDHSSAGSDT
ncbi:MAG: hypothetical protein JO199_09540, partial [Candidatus Eremiobacteraeota bacterium]|nr:hypothetical protein [Candidatus Eremiobacteraeota bacterium]